MLVALELQSLQSTVYTGRWVGRVLKSQKSQIQEEDNDEDEVRNDDNEHEEDDDHDDDHDHDDEMDGKAVVSVEVKP